MSKQILALTKEEIVLLEVILTGALKAQEEKYNKNKKDKGFLKTQALSGINLLKGLKDKIDVLEL